MDAELKFEPDTESTKPALPAATLDGTMLEIV
jgi:hypothetical protein